MKVSDKYVKQTIEEYEPSIHTLDDKMVSEYPTTIISGGIHYIVNMSIAEFIQQNNAVLLEDIKKNHKIK